jgi:hypothetical protein
MHTLLTIPSENQHKYVQYYQYIHKSNINTCPADKPLTKVIQMCIILVIPSQK